MKEEVINLQEIISGLKKRWQVIVIITLLSMVISTILSFFVIKPKYEASVKLFIGKESSSESYNNSDITMYQQLVKTYANVIKTEDLVDKALKEGALELNTKSVASSLVAEQIASTQLMVIKYVSTNKAEAAKIVELVTNEFVKEAPELFKNAEVKVVQSVKVPEKPISPNKTMNIAIAMTLGLMVGIGLALLLEFMDNTFRKKEDLEEIIGVPVLGIIPIEEGGKDNVHSRKTSKINKRRSI